MKNYSAFWVDRRLACTLWGADFQLSRFARNNKSGAMGLLAKSIATVPGTTETESLQYAYVQIEPWGA